MFTLAAGSAFAFHDGGVAKCDGCHSMHNSADNPVSGDPNPTLLKGTDASSTCLNCHAGAGSATSYHILSTDASVQSAGGDFYWLEVPAYKIGRSNQTPENRGHNIIAADFGLLGETNPSNFTAPGGTYSANLLGCTSCHDAHGQVHNGTKGGSAPISVSGSYGAVPVAGTIAGNFRLLGDSDYEAGNLEVDGHSYTYDAPVAVSIANFYGTRYGSGMSEWCSNCHADFGVNNDGNKHVAADDAHLDGYAVNYNAYVATGNYDNAPGAAHYDDLVPFETGDTNNTTMAKTAPTAAVGSNVMCLTCHRAHATAFNNAGRWPFSSTLFVEEFAASSLDAALKTKAFYKEAVSVDMVTEYGEFQRSLCNKCHVQD